MGAVWALLLAQPGSPEALTEPLGSLLGLCRGRDSCHTAPLLCPQLPPYARRVRLPAGLGRPALQRELPTGHARARLPGALPVSARWRLPCRQRPLPVRTRLHGEAASRPRDRRSGVEPGRPLTRAPSASRDLTALTSAHPTRTGSTAPPAAPAKMPSPAPPSTARAFARKVMDQGLWEGSGWG